VLISNELGMTLSKILLVDDEPDLLDVLKITLEAKGHTVQCASSGEDALHYLRVYQYDLIILDWMMPHMTGVEALRHFRDEMHGKTPVLMLTAKSSLDDKELGLDSGSDDYLTKPFDNRELMARVRALLRRPQSLCPTILKAGDLELDPIQCQIKKAGVLLNVRPKVYSLLEFFMRHPKQMFEPQQIIDRVWSDDSAATVETLRTHIKLLRKSVGFTKTYSMLESYRNLGYRFNPDLAQESDFDHDLDQNPDSQVQED